MKKDMKTVNINNFKSCIIYGEKIYLKRLNRKNLKTSVKWLSDPEINKFLSRTVRNLTLKQELEWFQSISISTKDIVFTINTREEKEYIGNCALHKMDFENLSGELGIFIGKRDYLNKGYGTDAVKTILGFAAESLGLKKISLIVYEYNKRAINAYQKCGFNTVNILKRYHCYNNILWDAYLMELSLP